MTQKNFFTSDWHVGHANVLIYDARPFRDLDHMHTVLVNNYNSSVSKEDVCYFLGDIGLGKGELISTILSQLNGTKVLIRGNHDKGPTAMKRMGFDLVLNMAAIQIGKSLVTMSHCPLRGIKREDCSSMAHATETDNWHGEAKHTKFSLPDWGQFHLHGHTHKDATERTLGRQFDVGVKANNYFPVSSRTLESWLSNEGLK